MINAFYASRGLSSLFYFRDYPAARGRADSINELSSVVAVAFCSTSIRLTAFVSFRWTLSLPKELLGENEETTLSSPRSSIVSLQETGPSNAVENVPFRSIILSLREG